MATKRAIGNGESSILTEILLVNNLLVFHTKKAVEGKHLGVLTFDNDNLAMDYYFGMVKECGLTDN